MVARGQPTDSFANFADDSGTLVTADNRQRKRQVTGHEVLVAVAHS